MNTDDRELRYGNLRGFAAKTRLTSEAVWVKPSPAEFSLAHIWKEIKRSNTTSNFFPLAVIAGR